MKYIAWGAAFLAVSFVVCILFGRFCRVGAPDNDRKLTTDNE